MSEPNILDLPALDSFVRSVIDDHLATGRVPSVRTAQVVVKAFEESPNQPEIRIEPEVVNTNGGSVNLGGGDLNLQGGSIDNE